MEIRYLEYFWVKATIVIPYACGLTSVDVEKYQQPFWRRCRGMAAIFFEPSSSSYLYPIYKKNKNSLLFFFSP
jgi:hypothetical protein